MVHDLRGAQRRVGCFIIYYMFLYVCVVYVRFCFWRLGSHFAPPTRPFLSTHESMTTTTGAAAATAAAADAADAGRGPVWGRGRRAARIAADGCTCFYIFMMRCSVYILSVCLSRPSSSHPFYLSLPVPLIHTYTHTHNI